MERRLPHRPHRPVKKLTRSLRLTNGSENDIRCYVTKRTISDGTRSDTGRDARDALLSIAKTCAKLGITFFDYLGDRLNIYGATTIPSLPQIVGARA